MDRKPWEPEQVFGEYESGRNFKAGLGRRGLYEQGKINERFYVGDQWHGAQCGNERPLVRHNVIKRIGDYKMAVISSNPVTVNYSVEGVPNTVAIRDRAREERDRYAGEQRTPMDAMGLPPEEETAVTMSSLTDYFKTTAERVKLDDLKEQALRNAYISGSGVLYTYWDDRIQTGLYADEKRHYAHYGRHRLRSAGHRKCVFRGPEPIRASGAAVYLDCPAEKREGAPPGGKAQREAGIRYRGHQTRPGYRTYGGGPLGRRAGGNPEGHGDNQVLEGMGQGRRLPYPGGCGG